MTTVFAFCFGAFLSGITLAIVFGAFYLEAEEKAYKQGYEDGRKCNGRFRAVKGGIGMTESEAKKILERLLSDNVLVGNETTAVSMASNALEKQITKKLIVQKECFSRAKDGKQDFVILHFCPNCNTRVRVDFKHCYECGQKLDSEV